MNEKIHRIIMVISVCLASFCIASIIAVVIVDKKATDINFNPSKPHYNGVSFSEKLPSETDSPENTEISSPQTDNTPEETEDSQTYNFILKDTNVENIKTENKKMRPSPKEVIESIPFSEKTRILRKYLPKMSSQDIKYFTSLLKNKKIDYNEAKKRLFQIYTPEEIKELYNIYTSYEDKIYENYR